MFIKKKSYQLLICRVAKNLPVLKLLNHFIKSSTVAYKGVAYKKNLVYFCTFTPLTVQKIKIFWKMKKKKNKTPGDIIISYKCTKNHDMLYCSWDKAYEECYYFLFWSIFCPFTPPTAQKFRIKKKRKKNPKKP